jgi:hypothetical protein
MIWKTIAKRPGAHKLHKSTRRPRSMLAVEVLEDRCLLSVTSSVFLVDPAASTLTLSGSVNGFPLQQQGNGSLTSSYSGSILADWDLDGLTLNLDLPGTSLNAKITGTWQPNPDGTPGSAPADYGGQVTALFLTGEVALRNVVIAVSTADPLPLSGTGPYSFPSTESLMVLQGTADYDTPFGSGSQPISSMVEQNAAPQASTFQSLGNGSYRVTIPVNLTLQQVFNNTVSAVVHIQGQIVATAVLPVVNLSNGTTSNFNYSTTAIADGGPVAIEDPAATVTRTPPGDLTSMTVTLINHPDGAAESLGYNLGSSGLTTNGYDPASGKLVITGNAAPPVYQAVLRTLTYENDSLTPDTSDRPIQVVVNDGTNTSLVRTTTVSISPQVATAFSVDPSVTTVTAGSPFSITVTAVDARNNAVPNYAGTIHFLTINGATLPAVYTFISSDQGTHTFDGVVLTSAGTQTVSVSDTANSISGAASVDVTPAAATQLILTAPASNTSATPFDLTVTALDPYGNIDTNYAGTIHFTSTDGDPGVMLPGDYTFASADGGTHTFSGGVILIIPGDQTLTVTDPATGITGSAIVTIVPPGGGDAASAVGGPVLITWEAQALASLPGQWQSCFGRSLLDTCRRPAPQRIFRYSNLPDERAVP